MKLTTTGKIKGIRCSQDKYNNLYIGTPKDGVLFNDVFSERDLRLIKQAIYTLREQGGAFWYNPKDRIIAVVTDETKEKRQFPQFQIRK